jgi:hypothetical protein
MAFVLADRVKETTTTTGTGTVTLLGAATGYQSFAAIGNANNTYYTIAGQTGSEWEVGIGTYTSAGTTLSRDTVLASSNSGSLVTFSAGTKDVFVVYPAKRSLYSNGAITTNATYYPTISATNAAGTQEISTSASLTYNPSTGALTATSHVSSSDERLKTDWADLPENFVELLAQVKHGLYTRIREGNREAGVSAQSFAGVLPQSVVVSDEGSLSVMYGNAALVACIQLSKRVVQLEAKLAELTKGSAT